MAIIDRDLATCAERIQKRRELLLKLYNENQAELANPALIEDEKPITGECQEFMCLVNKHEKEDPRVRKQKIILKVLGASLSVLIILLCTLLAVLISRVYA
ncbi:Uncharacterised protein (plasmid) [Mesomycoplasma conjunctivae]|nr:hypothetical protein [Mycoplasmopsis fermentans]ADV34554.1 Hypothetical Protein MfeM64YM_0556 [Mycoplasmopsis fermentans M64]VEU64110.1 Uncharacterised protein [Mycoplasmopsis fermentans]VEU66749.1 Uncharacterised protein [Mesomycoplasma conjunctivae]